MARQADWGLGEPVTFDVTEGRTPGDIGPGPVPGSSPVATDYVPEAGLPPLGAIVLMGALLVGGYIGLRWLLD
jgi:hypothetical protein